MVRNAMLHELAAAEADEMALLSGVRNRQRQRRRLRAALLTVDEDRVGVRARIHLLDPEVEQPLRARLTDLEDELALRRHARLDAPHTAAELARTVEQRDVVVAYLDEHTPVVDITVGRAPAGGADWSLADAPRNIIDQADRCHAELRAGLVEAVDNLVDSELVTTGPSARVGSARAAGAIADLELVEHDPDAVAEVGAFVADVRMIGSAAEQLRERLRLAALRGSVEQPRDWLLGASLRRRDARHALERSRAVHAALAELNRMAQLSE